MSKPQSKLARASKPPAANPQFPQRAGNMTPRLCDQFKALHDTVKKLLKQGCICKSTLEKVKELDQFVNDNEVAIQRFIKKNDEEHVMELRYLKSRCMTSEIFDQFGLRKEAKEASQEGAEFIEHIPSEVNLSGQVFESREILREKIRLCIDYAQTHFYREHDYPKAQELVFRCLNFVEKFLQKRGEFNCYGTLGQIYYVAGKIYRQQNDFNAAEDCFSLSIENYHHRVQAKINQAQQAHESSAQFHQRLDDDLALARLKSGISLALGIGWINYARGHLHQALSNNIRPARVLLLHSRDELSSAYLDLIYSSITRALSNKDAAELKKAVHLAEGAYNTFWDNGHRQYMGRAAWELGLAHFYSGQFDEAEKRAIEVEDISLAFGDHRWICNALILRSRIEHKRGQFDELQKVERYSLAEELASSAIKNAEEHRQTLCEINALITRGSARIDLNRIAEARDDLHKALAINRESDSSRTNTTANPKVEALCYLYLSRSYAREAERLKANENFLKWENLERDVEHIYVRELAHEVEQEIIALKKDFLIKSESGVDLNYKKWNKELQRFLLQEAKSTSQKKQEIADRLGISRQTLLDWEEELESKNK